MRKPSFRQVALEFVVVIWLGLLYSAFFLGAAASDQSLALRGLNPANRIQAIEHERLAGLMIPVQIGLGLNERVSGIGHLPTWNPYLGTGTPLVNDAFFYLFNPFMSLPLLVLGAVQGSKIAIVIGLLMAGLNMWVFARAIGLGAVARVTVAALYLMSGGIIGKFNSGHFQLGLSLAWPPLVLAGLWWTVNSRDRRAPVLMAVAFALMFFSGNIYYTLHTLICCLVIVAAHGVSRAGGHWQIAWGRLRRVLIGGLLALGLTMIQFLPVWAVRDYVSHKTVTFNSITGQIIGQHDLGLSLTTLITPWDVWQWFEQPVVGLQSSVDYAYIGPTVFALIAGLIALMLLGGAGYVRHRRAAGIALTLAIVMMIWGAGQTGIVNALYRHIPLLAEFRFLGRAYAIAGMWWIVLAGIALDTLWRAARQGLNLPVTFELADRVRLLRALTIPALLWLWLLAYSLSNNLTRLTMTLNNLTAFNALNNWRFVDYPQALQTLVDLIALALIVDTLLLFVYRRFVARTPPDSNPLTRVMGARLARIGLLLLALTGIRDVMTVNHQLISFGPPANNFGSLYAATLGIDRATTPFPSIQEPFSPSAFDAYSSQIRNWGLNEGWLPRPLAGDIIPTGAPKLVSLPGWAIVSTEYERGGTYALAQRFVDQHQGIQRACVNEIASVDDPCDIETRAGSVLYEIPDSLPYAFIAAEDTLQQRADSLTGATVTAARVISHDMDTISLQATAPDQRHYLIVQETHFPGWRALVDGQETTTVTVGSQAPASPSSGFIGIPMMQGTHTYSLRYDPPGFKTGIIISGLTAMASVAYLIGRRRPPHQPAPQAAPESGPVVPTVVTPAIDEPSIPVITGGRKTIVFLGLLAVAVITIYVVVNLLWNQKKAADNDSLDGTSNQS